MTFTHNKSPPLKLPLLYGDPSQDVPPTFKSTTVLVQLRKGKLGAKGDNLVILFRPSMICVEGQQLQYGLNDNKGKRFPPKKLLTQEQADFKTLLFGFE